MGLLGILAVAVIAAIMYFYYPVAGPAGQNQKSIDQYSIQKAQDATKMMNAHNAETDKEISQ